MGDPRARDRAAVAADLRDGLISADAARDVYGLLSAIRHANALTGERFTPLSSSPPQGGRGRGAPG